MPSGKIKRLMKDRGFGFIRGNDGQEVFFHRSSLDGITFESLAEGQEVEFEIEQSPKDPEPERSGPSAHPSRGNRPMPGKILIFGKEG